MTKGSQVRARAIERWKKYHPEAKILKEAGCSARTLRGWIREAGATRDPADAPTNDQLIAVRRGRRYTDEQRDEAISMWLRDVPSREICETVGCSLRTLNYWTKGMSRDVDLHRHSEEVRNRAVDQYVKEAMSCSAIAKLIGNGVTHATVAAWIREAGLELREQPRIDDKRVAGAFARLGSISAVARELGHAPQAVRRSLQRSCLAVDAGVPSNAP